MLGRRIERTLELLNWVMVVCILGGFLLAGAVSSCLRSIWAAAVVGMVGFDLPDRHVQLRPRATPTFSCWRRSRLFGRRRHGEHRALELGARQGLRNGAARRIHSGGGRWPQGEARAYGFHLHARRRQHAPMERLVADRPRRSVGRVFHRRACSAWCCRRCSTSRCCRKGPTSRDRALPRRSRRPWRRARAPLLGGSSWPCSRAWILFKTQLDIIESMVRSLTDILWTGSHRVRTGAVATCASCITARSRSCVCGESSRCGWRSRSSSSCSRRTSRAWSSRLPRFTSCM